MEKEVIRRNASKQRNDLLDALYALPEHLRTARVSPLDLQPYKTAQAIRQYIGRCLLPEDIGVEIYDSNARCESISQITVHRALQGVLIGMERAASEQQWRAMAALLQRPVVEALQSMQLLDAMWSFLPEEFDQPMLETYHTENERVLCVRVNHRDGSYLAASTPIVEESFSFVGAEAPRHPGSWFAQQDADLVEELLQG